MAASKVAVDSMTDGELAELAIAVSDEIYARRERATIAEKGVALLEEAGRVGVDAEELQVAVTPKVKPNPKSIPPAYPSLGADYSVQPDSRKKSKGK